MKNLLLLISLVLFLQGCSSNRDIEHKHFDINTDDVSAVKLDDFFKLKQVIPLDSCKDAFLDAGYITNLMFVKDKMVMSTYRDPQIRVFNQDGTLYKAINRAGRGPEEYSDMVNIVVQDDDLLIVAGFAGERMYYDVDGKFIKKNEAVKDALQFSEDFFNLPDGNFLVYKGLRKLMLRKDLNEPYYSANLVSKEGKVLRNLVERSVNTPPAFFVSPGSSSFYQYKNEVYLAPMTENTIYQYSWKDSLLQPIYSFTFNHIDFIGKLEAAKDNAALGKFTSEVYFTAIMGVTENYMVISAFCQGIRQGYVILFNKKRGEYQLIDDKAYKGVNCGRVLRNSTGRLITAVTYQDLVDKEGTLLDIPLVKQIQKVTPLHENMNAVICIYDEK